MDQTGELLMGPCFSLFFYGFQHVTCHCYPVGCTNFALCIGAWIPTWGHWTFTNVGRSSAAGVLALFHCASEITRFDKQFGDRVCAKSFPQGYLFLAGDLAGGFRFHGLCE